MRAPQDARPSRLRAAARAIYAVVAAITTIGMGVVAIYPRNAASDGQFLVLIWAIFVYFSVYIPKYIFVLVDLVRQGLALIFRRPLRGIAIGAAAVASGLFIALWWGALVTRFSIDVREVEIPVAGLPSEFSGYRIVQLSDMHTGTYGNNPRFLTKVVEKVNALHPDIILFTGDIVNRHSDELEPFVATLAALRAPDGVWSVMGNHDYGDYYAFRSLKAKRADVDNLHRMQARMGWKMLNNAHTVLHRGNDSIVLIGVENIGDPPFHSYGDLRQAYPALDDDAVKILMSHNPAHWVDSIADHDDVNIALTLSGHTHAMQMEMFGWSPASIRYPTWGGRYTDSLGRSLYVNIGLGEVGFPARLGAPPEITLIKLVSY